MKKKSKKKMKIMKKNQYKKDKKKFYNFKFIIKAIIYYKLNIIIR